MASPFLACKKIIIDWGGACAPPNYFRSNAMNSRLDMHSSMG